jgi:hypothetical protein
MNYIDISNKTALEFNKSSASRMREISVILYNHGITQFTFCRSFKDGKRLYLSCDPQWVEYYLKNNFQDYLEHLEHYIPPVDIKYSFWAGFKGDKVFDALYDYKIGHGFAIYEHHKEYVDQFDFATHRENYLMTNFYLKNMIFLEEFIKNFKIKAHDLINSPNQSKLIIPSKGLSFQDVTYKSFITEDKINSFMEKITGTKIV